MTAYNCYMRKPVLGDRYLPQATQQVGAIWKLGSQSCFFPQRLQDSPPTSFTVCFRLPEISSSSRAMVGRMTYQNYGDLTHIF